MRAMAAATWLLWFLLTGGMPGARSHPLAPTGDSPHAVSLRSAVVTAEEKAAMAGLGRVLPAGPIFEDGFETGDVCRWTSGGCQDPPPSGHSFRIESPPVELAPSERVTYCYYFRTPNTETVAVKKWSSEMTPGAEHSILLTTTDTGGQPADKQPPGTISATGCNLEGSTVLSWWVYAAFDPSAELDFPLDDGSGKPLAMTLPPNHPMFLYMRFVNPTNQMIEAHVTLDAETYEAGTDYTRVDTFVAYNGSVYIPPSTSFYVEQQTCQTPVGAEFWRLSTFTHKYSVETSISESGSVLLTGTDWQHPPVALAYYRTFSTGHLTFSCAYDNPTPSTITFGESEDDNERCMAIGYFFPATKPLSCYNGLGPF